MQHYVPTKDLLKQIGKDPRSYVIFLFAGLIYYFVFKFTGASDLVNANCETEKAALRKEKEELSRDLTVERQWNNTLILQLIKKEQSAEQLDSLLRTKLEEKTKENLQNK